MSTTIELEQIDTAKTFADLPDGEWFVWARTLCRKYDKDYAADASDGIRFVFNADRVVLPVDVTITARPKQ